MNPIKTICLLLFLLISLNSNGQVVKTKTAISIWKFQDQIISDSIKTIEYHFDSLSNKVSAWNLMKDTLGLTIDSIKTIYDKRGNPISFQHSKKTEYLIFDKNNTLVKTYSLDNNLDTISIIYLNPTYRNDSLIQLSISADLKIFNDYEVYHTGQVENQILNGKLNRRTLYDNNDKWLYQEINMLSYPYELIENYRIYDDNGKLHKEIYTENNEITRKVTHIYSANGLEKYRYDEKFKEKISITSSFVYEFWEL